MIAQRNFFVWIIGVITGMIMFAAPVAVQAQYSSDVMDLKELSDLYDERGYMQSKSITVDGKLIVSNSNGNVSYSYPISSTTVSGYPFDVTLNYCGSVAFTAFLDFDAGSPGNPYTHWRKFHQNRPAWVLGVNGFAVGVMASSSSFHCHPDLRGTTGTNFDDDDFIWAIDGFDFSNRMARIETASGSNYYVDEIRILKADGSLLHLVNAKKPISGLPATNRADLYTGYYYVNEANSRGFGVVEFDSTYWPWYIRNHITGSPAYQHIPRKLRYYDGSGLEYVFQEWVIPYGKQPYLGQGFVDQDRYGSTVGGPTIFYLERINSNAGQISQFYRSRHYYPNERTWLAHGNIYMPQLDSTLDSTRGRALITEFHGHKIGYGDVGIIIESFGRTIKAQFGTIAHSGNGGGSSMPLGTCGYLTTTTAALANAQESADALYGSHLGYITEIIDPEGRKTEFEYESYTRNYVNYGFPRTSPGPGVDISLALQNYRLKEITEPTAIYKLSYARGDVMYGGIAEDVIRKDTIRAGIPSPHDPFRLNNVASYVRKYDRSNNLLTTQHSEFVHSGSGFVSGLVTTTDNITGLSRSIYTSYEILPLPESHNPTVPQPRFTALENTTETGATTVSTSTSYVDTTNAGYLWLPYEQTVEVDGYLTSKQRFSYLLDTVRTFGGDTALRRRFGWEPMRRTVEIFNPGTNRVLLRDTVEYVHVPLVDTTLVELDSLFQKLITLQRYRDSIAQPGSRFRNIPWEYASYDSAIASYLIDSSVARHTLPPIYGLESRSWRSDSTGRFLGGQSHAYNMPPGAPHYFHDMAFRGTLHADTIFGRDRLSSYVSARYNYTRGWGLNLLSRKFNALGASERYFYSSYASLKLRDAYGAYRPLGKIVSNDDVVRDTLLPHNSYFSLAFEKPLISESYIRRYEPGGALVIDTLLQMNEYTHYGQVKGSIDMNGYYSRFEYDRNGRLKTAWLPRDFPSIENPDTVQYIGTESVGLYGSTFRSLAVDTMKCTDTTWKYKYGIPDTTEIEDLYAGHPIHVSDDYCPCGSPSGIESIAGPDRRPDKGPDRELLASCFTWVKVPTRDYFFGHLPIHADSGGPMARAITLDSAWLMLHTSSIQGSCVTLTVKIPQYEFSKSFLFNCPDLPPPHDDKAKRKNDRELQSGGLSTIRSIRVDLSEIKTELLGLASGKIDVYLHVTNPDGGIRFVNGDNAEDTRPQLMLKGTFNRLADTADYTLAYTYDDAGLSTTITAKVDDSSHTANRFGPAQPGGVFARRTQAKHFFGPDYQVRGSHLIIGNPAAPERTDTVRYTYTGLGARAKTTNQMGDTVVMSYDASGRPTRTINPDGSETNISYYSGNPTTFGITDQDFHGFCKEVVAMNENGVKHVRFYDAFDSLRREVMDRGGMDLTTRYDYDIQGRLERIINPKGDTIRYTYDDFGRVRTKSQPDLGTVSYAYDRAGNVRFTQTEKQANENRVTFNQYDDLNRLVYIGEAGMEYPYYEEYDDICVSCYQPMVKGGKKDPEEKGRLYKDKSGSKREDIAKENHDRALQSVPPRLTDLLDPNRLNDDSTSTILTANHTLWMKPEQWEPSVPFDFYITSCVLSADTSLGEISAPVGPVIVRPASFYQSAVVQPATAEDFEHIARHSRFGRMAVAYDSLPAVSGAVWEKFPEHEKWDDIAPYGKVRNQKGRESAVAYRERPGEPYNFVVLSYDERGRVEALMRYTENLGFDAVYYSYNSMNQAVSMTSVDVVRQHTTWHGYDQNGRIDSIWTYLGAPTSGFFSAAGIEYPGISERPDSAVITYKYNRTGMLDSLSYPLIRTGIRYLYNNRGWLDSLAATHRVPGLGSQPIFTERLIYDTTGQIVTQKFRQGTGAVEEQEYIYDRVNRLTRWKQGADTTSYDYDAVGNRIDAYSNGAVKTDNNLYMPGSSNQVSERVQADMAANWGWTNLYRYNANGSMTERRHFEQIGVDIFDRGIEQYGYSHRELPRRFVRLSVPDPWYLPTMEEDWHYRYSASGERDQKRLYYRRSYDTISEEEREYPWVYYLLGGDNRQLAIYHGRQMNRMMCGDTGMRVLMYPAQYLTYGNGATPSVVTFPDGSRRYYVKDHLGTVRSILDDARIIVTTADFEPFGGIQAVTGEKTRHGYIGKEVDRENGVALHGIRMYCASEGRFQGTEPKLEKYASVSPYQYAGNSPLVSLDIDGRDLIILHDKDGAMGRGHMAILVGNDKSGWRYYSMDGESEIVSGEDLDVAKNVGHNVLEFLASEDGKRYKQIARFSTSDDADKAGVKTAEEKIKMDYSISGYNCVDFTADVAKSMDIKIPLERDVHPLLGLFNPAIDPSFTSPNLTFELIKKMKNVSVSTVRRSPGK